MQQACSTPPTAHRAAIFCIHREPWMAETTNKFKTICKKRQNKVVSTGVTVGSSTVTVGSSTITLGYRTVIVSYRTVT